jgi:hypothetical protein
MLRITDLINEPLELTKRADAIMLELKLNVSQYGRQWSHIGDELFSYKDGEDKVIKVTTDQYMFLKMLQSV